MEKIIGVFGVDWRLLAFQILNFLLLLWLLRRFMYGPVLRIIEERRHKAEEGVRNAEAAAHLLISAGEEASAEKAAAVRSANEIVEKGKRHAEEKQRALLKEAEKEKEKILVGAAEDAARLKRKALEESNEEITRIAILAAERILKQQ